MRVKELDNLASNVIGDSKAPELHFVSSGKLGVVTVSRDFDVAYSHFRRLLIETSGECCLESRSWGVVATREPKEDGSKTLVTTDWSHEYRRAKKLRRA